MRNQTRLLELIEELLGKAMNKITAEYREEQLKAVKVKLEAENAKLAAFRESEKGETYNDEEAKQYSEVRAKNIRDILIPFFKADLENLSKAISGNEASTESIDSLQLLTLERIETLRSEIKDLKESAKARTGEFQMLINDEIPKKAEDIESRERELVSYIESLVKLIIKRAETNVNIENASQSIKKLEAELVSLSKDGKFVSYKKVVAKATEDEMESTLAELNKKKKLLATKPDLLAEDLIRLVKNGATEAEISEKLTTLKILAGELIPSYEGLRTGVEVTPLEKTIGDLTSQRDFYANNALGLQQNAINNTILISKMVSGIIYYMELINRAKIVKNNLSKDMQSFEKEFTRLPGIRANIKKADDMITRLELAKEAIYKTLEATISYNMQNTIKQCSSNFMESQAVISLSQLESKKTNPFDITIENLEITEALLSGVYQASSEDNISEVKEEPNLLDQLKGDEHFLYENPAKSTLGTSKDLSTMNPNSLGEEAVVTLEPTRLTTLIEEPETTLPLQIEDQADKKKEEDLPLSDTTASEEAIEETQPKEETPSPSENQATDYVEKAPTTELSLEPIPVAGVTKTNNQLLDPTVEEYVPYRERTENVIPFRVGTPPSPNPRVLSSRRVLFESRLKDLAIAGVFGNLKERGGYKL